MGRIEQIQELLKEKADLQARAKMITVDGSLEIKEIEGEKYIYTRKRVLGRNTSTYIDKYDEGYFAFLQKQLTELRQLKKDIRKIEKKLAEMGYEEKSHSARVVLNIEFAHANMKTSIFDQAILEGISTTFPQTEEVLENGIVSGLTALEVQKILNLQRAWQFILDKDVLAASSDYYLLSHIAKIVNEGVNDFGGKIRRVPVRIGGSTYVPPLPIEQEVKEKIAFLVNGSHEAIDTAIELALFCMKTQVFTDGNKRSAILFANHHLISNGQGLLIVSEEKVKKFKDLLIAFYEDKEEGAVREFLKNECWRQF